MPFMHYQDFSYAIETLSIEIARLKAASRLQAAQPVEREYERWADRVVGRFDREIQDLQEAIELLQQVAEQRGKEYNEKHPNPLFTLGEDDGDANHH